MYLGETQSQSISMNSICSETIHGMERAISAIDTFSGNMLLRGQTYDSAKAFMSQTYRPLANGIIYLCEELIRQNNKYPEQFQSEIAATDVVEQEVREQIQQIDRLILETEELSNSIPLIGSTIGILQNMKARLEYKLNRLYTFNATTANNYETAMELASNVTAGLAQIQGGSGFNSHNGTFSIDGMNMDWVRNIQEVRAHAAYPEYLRQNPDKVEKIITIMMYEESNSQYVQRTDEFLEPLEERDVVEIKYLIYTAEEPYRMLAMKYLDRFEIISTTEKGTFIPSDNAVKFNISEDRVDSRGSYYTFFHEIGHAIDYYYGIDNEYDGYFSDSFTIDGKTLNNHMYEDAGDNFRSELDNVLQSDVYDHLSIDKKAEMIDNVTENLLNQNRYHRDLTDGEKDIQRELVRFYKETLDGPDHNTASDVYGGVTNKVIEGSYSHKRQYWINEQGERIREPNKEGFAEYYGRIMVPEGDSKEAGLKSIEDFLPTSKQYMDDIFDEMDER
jgi:hypothetical protein